MKNREMDPGLKYLLEIGFERVKGKYGLSERLEKAFDKTKALQIWKEWHSLPTGSKEFYDFKNSDPKLSKIFSEAYDFDILRKACNYVDSQKENFGATILEVGCESGYMTGFLAKTFPDARIVSIDRSQAAIDIAKQRADAIGIRNVEFRTAYLNAIEEKFDTVFCMRTIQENINSDDCPFIGEPLMLQFFLYDEMTEDYTKQLINCIKDDGTLCIFERVGHNPLMCGWMMGLCLAECAPDINTYQEIVCEEAGTQNTFQAFVCRNKTEGDPQKMINLWSNAIQIDVTGKAELTGWNALAYLSANAGEMIRGVRVIATDGGDEQVGRFAVFTDKDKDSLLYYLNAAGGSEIKLYGCPANEKDKVLEHMQKTIDKNLYGGHRIVEIDPNEDFIEGNRKEE